MSFIITNITEKQLAQARPGVNTPVTVYTCPADTIATIREIAIANTSGMNQTYSLFHDETGTPTYDETTAIKFDAALPKDASESGIVGSGFAAMSAGGTIGFQIGVADAGTITIYGTEIDIST